MARIIGIDFGEKRVGIAATDSLQIIANAVGTVENARAIDFIKDYIAHEPVECIVMGRPKTLGNEPAAITPQLDAFAAQLQQLFPTIPIEWVDERYTSLLAQRAMIDGGMKKKDRREKGRLDSIAATIILQTYMEMKRQ